MITTTHSPLRAVKTRSPRRLRGFTLVEVMISATLASFLLLAVLTSFLFLGRSGANMQNYVDMEAQARRTIETFAEDVRMAKDATWNSSNSLTLTVLTSSGATATRTYTYDPTAKNFSRTAGTTTTILLTGIVPFAGSEMLFSAYQIDTTAVSLATGVDLVNASKLTKQVQISLRSIRSTTTVTDATNSVISARFILRNKRITS